MWMSHRQQVWISPVVACIGGLLGILVYGFDNGVGNNEFHVMLVSRISEGLTWPGDLLTPTLDRYTSLLWPLVGRVATVVSEPTAFLSFFAGARLLFIAGLTALILAFWDTSRPRALIAGTVLSLLPGFLLALPLGDDPAFSFYLSQTFVSLGCCLLAIGAAVTGRPLLAGLACGAALASNVMQGSFAVALLVALGGTGSSASSDEPRPSAARTPIFCGSGSALFRCSCWSATRSTQRARISSPRRRPSTGRLWRISPSSIGGNTISGCSRAERSASKAWPCRSASWRWR